MFRHTLVLPVQSSAPPAPTDQTESTRLRLAFLGLLVASLFVLLVARLWFLQVMAGERYAAAAEGNAVRTLSVEAPRGRLLDRDGEPIVRNRYAQVVSVQPGEIPRQRKQAVLSDLADLLGIPVTELSRRIEGSRVSPFRPSPVAVDVPVDIVFYIHENASTRFPGVYAERLPLRDYPYGTLAAHLVGHLGEISADQLSEPQFKGYRSGDVIGWAGVERTYEPILRGVEGRRQVLVNAVGKVLGNFREEPPKPGGDVRLTIVLQAQQQVEKALANGIAVAQRQYDKEEGRGRGGLFKAPAGAAVVLDPRSGEVVAMASFPAYSPAEFVGGVSQQYWSWLQDKNNAFPLINRSIQASYPPGSVFKVVSAAAALQGGYLSQSGQLPCPASYEWNGTVYRNWRKRDSGSMDLATALEQSCDTVFYQLARSMWQDEQATPKGQPTFERLADEARGWGLGKDTGVDLPGERAGVVPGRGWKRGFWERARSGYCVQAQRSDLGGYARRLYTELCSPRGAVWRGGDEVNMAIGQGDVQTTPLQVADLFAGIANQGTVMRPHVVREIVRRDGSREPAKPQPLVTLPVSAADLAYIQSGLVRVTGPGGTAGGAFDGLGVPIAGKTGTAEFGKSKQPFAWFAGYNTQPVSGAQYVVVVMVEEGGGGSQTAAPIVRRIFEDLFGLEQTAIAPGVPTD
ncbi:MAG: penicillin-binding protein 2 [Egibacteraceae bacterium]